MSTATGVLPTTSFHADADPEAVARLRSIYRAERREMAERSLAICATLDPAGTRNAIKDAIESRRSAITDDDLFEDPAFVTWSNFLQRAVARQSEAEAQMHCRNFAGLLERVAVRLSGEATCYIPGTRIALQQQDIDPYLMAVTPPSYDFAKLLRTGMNGHGHPLGLQSEVLGIAFATLQSAWPQLHADVLDVVKIVGYLPDATFRSCSAARYSGVLYLGNLDESLLDIEESIVHEAGHQVLYRVGWLESLVVDDAPRAEDYTLPWSGTKRDLFGFLHAYYIYALLAKYFWRRATAIPAQHGECVRRSALIMIGSTIATDMLLADRDLTPFGRGLVESLGAELARLRDELEAAYAGLVDDRG